MTPSQIGRFRGNVRKKLAEVARFSPSGVSRIGNGVSSVTPLLACGMKGGMLSYNRFFGTTIPDMFQSLRLLRPLLRLLLQSFHPPLPFQVTILRELTSASLCFPHHLVVTPAAIVPYLTSFPRCPATPSYPTLPTDHNQKPNSDVAHEQILNRNQG